MSDIDQIEDIIENSYELTNKQKGPLRWAVRKVREELSATAEPPKRYAASAPAPATSRFNQDDDTLDKLDSSDPFAEEDIPF